MIVPALAAILASAGMNADTFAGLSFRSIGPAVTGGRVVAIAVDPTNRKRWFVAAGSGGVWRTNNAGTTWTPVFDKEGSYSIGAVAIDPRNPSVVWVGTGENNSQRAVQYGDGVYRSEDSGASWKKLGLENSEHISRILIDPRSSSTVYVAAQGPLWAPGGDRGLYKTTDGGKTWKGVLSISKHTGVTEVVMDPRDPDVLYAAAYQRRRHVYTLVDGGPESAIHKSTDAGATWTKLTNGLPKEQMGRIGLTLSPANPDVLYAQIETGGKERGVYRTTDRGATWEKRSDYVPGGAMAYAKPVADPKNADRLYGMDVFMQVSDDAGKTWRRLGESSKHVDNHVIWVDPDDNEHYLVGCDGGVYESFDRAKTWRFTGNIPITQFYRVSADNASPIYNVMGGTQDNDSLLAPSRTTNQHGITNADWVFLLEGDGFVNLADPDDPNTVYTESQYGVLNRYDRKTGEQLLIQPQPAKGEDALRWNWDSPFLISPHSSKRLYFAAQRLFVTDDRGGSWRPISGDLTRQINRNTLKVMDRVWGPDAPGKHVGTSFFGNVVSLAESPKKEGLLYVGTDDGLVQVSEDQGKSWKKYERFPGVPDMTYVSRLTASSHDANVVYASFDAHKNGDFKPYVLKSSDRGKTWTSIAGDLPQRGSVYTIVDDPGDPSLLFCGTEFGIFFSKDGGARWIPLKGGLPTIAVRDIAIQKREVDLVIATFGRGIYILDDFTPLRRVTAAELAKDAVTFAVKKPLVFMPSLPYGLPGKAFLGDGFYAAANPPFGAVVTYYLKDSLKTKRSTRLETEAEAEKKNIDVSYPSLDALRGEAREEEPAVVVTIADSDGNVVRRLSAPAEAGFHRVAWDLRYPASVPTNFQRDPENPFAENPQGPMVPPGRYTATVSRRIGGTLTPIGEPQTFEAVPLNAEAMSAADRAALFAFEKKTAKLDRAARGASQAVIEALARVKHAKQALHDTPGQDPRLDEKVREVERRLLDVAVALRGDDVLQARGEPTAPAILDRIGFIVGAHWTASAAPTKTSLDSYEIAASEFQKTLADLKRADADLRAIEDSMESAGAPWTPGRIPTFTKE